VTGAGGFIGSHLVEALAKRGARVRALVHYNALGSYGWLDELTAKKKIEIVAGDICDPQSVERAMQGAAIVFHLAALIGIPYSYEAPESYVRTNVGGTLNILQASRRLKPDRIVLTSTSEVYGTARYVPIDESHPLQAQSPYSASKIAADKLGEAFYRSYDLPVVTLRPFNTYGPRQSARAIVPTIISQCLHRGKIKLGSLEPQRDLNFVSDLVEAFLLAGYSTKAVGHTVNIGSGKAVSIKELVERISRLIGNKKVGVFIDSKRVRPKKSEVNYLEADSALAQDLLGWKPLYSLEKGLRATIPWMKKHLERYGSIYSI